MTGAYCLHHHSDLLIALMMEAVSTSNASFNFDQTARGNIPEDSHLHTRRREKNIFGNNDKIYHPNKRARASMAKKAESAK
jgi:hypothetical protein